MALLFILPLVCNVNSADQCNIAQKANSANTGAREVKLGSPDDRDNGHTHTSVNLVEISKIINLQCMPIFPMVCHHLTSSIAFDFMYRADELNVSLLWQDC